MTNEFESTYWHDNAIHAIRIVDGSEGNSKLVLDIDFIAEWLPPQEGAFRFMIAPADLTFYEVSELVMAIDYKKATAGVQPMVIHEIKRTPVSYPSGYTSYQWSIEINWPPDGVISFIASHLSQELRKSAILSESQCLEAGHR